MVFRTFSSLVLTFLNPIAKLPPRAQVVFLAHPFMNGIVFLFIFNFHTICDQRVALKPNNFSTMLVCEHIDMRLQLLTIQYFKSFSTTFYSLFFSSMNMIFFLEIIYFQLISLTCYGKLQVEESTHFWLKRLKDEIYPFSWEGLKILLPQIQAS